MQRSTERILTTHTGSLPRTPGGRAPARRAEDSRRAQGELKSAVREAIAYVVGKQIECGIDVVNDGEQGRTDYTVHVLDRLAGFRRREHAAARHGDPEFPELAQLLAQFASPFQHRPSCNGEGGVEGFRRRAGRYRPVEGRDEGRQRHRAVHDLAVAGQIARYLKNRPLRDRGGLRYALADVMSANTRRCRPRLPAADRLPRPRDAAPHSLSRQEPGRFRKIIAVNVAALNHAVADIPAARDADARVLGLDHGAGHRRAARRHHRHLLTAKPTRLSFPAANGGTRTNGRSGAT